MKLVSAGAMMSHYSSWFRQNVRRNEQNILVISFSSRAKKTIQFSTNTVNSRLADTPITWTTAKYQGPVPERPISFNPGLKFCSVLYLHSYALLRVTFCVISTVSRSKDSTTLCNPELHVLRWENRAWNLASSWIKLNHLSRNRAKAKTNCRCLTEINSRY